MHVVSFEIFCVFECTKSCFRKLRASLNISTCTFILVPAIKFYCEDIPAVPVIHFYHNLYYSEQTELDTYVGI